MLQKAMAWRDPRELSWMDPGCRLDSGQGSFLWSDEADIGELPDDSGSAQTGDHPSSLLQLVAEALGKHGAQGTGWASVSSLRFPWL